MTCTYLKHVKRKCNERWQLLVGKLCLYHMFRVFLWMLLNLLDKSDKFLFRTPRSSRSQWIDWVRERFWLDVLCAHQIHEWYVLNGEEYKSALVMVNVPKMITWERDEFKLGWIIDREGVMKVKLITMTKKKIKNWRCSKP